MSTEDPDLMRLAVQERTSLLELLRTLEPQQWASRSLCSEWTVRQVATHVVSYDGLSRMSLIRTFARGGFRVGRVNEVALRRFDDHSDRDVVALVADHVEPRGLTAGFGGGIALTDTMIHQQDIRRALRLPRAIPTERLQPVLDFALRAPTLPARKNARSLRLVADDIDWQHGEGPEVTGPGEALLMTVAGRGSALLELGGPGLPLLASRVGA
jgi:uncharacterized protein (TIGR03083 family)